MGIILGPYILGAFIIFVKILFQFISLIEGNEFSISGIIVGILIPILIIILTIFYWMKKGKLYAFHPHFFFPFMLLYFPMLILLSLRNVFYFQSSILIDSILMVWIIFSGIVMTPLFFQITKFLKKKGVKFHY